jgi:hypothetical protein
VPGATRLAVLKVPLEPGTPPGEYRLRLSVYAEGEQSQLDILDEAGAPQGGPEIVIGPVTVAPPSFGWLGAEPPGTATRLRERLLEVTELLALRLTMPTQLEPGQRVPLTLWWRFAGPLPGATLHLAWQRGLVLTGEEQIVPGAGQDKLPLDGSRLTDSWIEGEFITDTFRLTLPQGAPPPPYQIEIGWYAASDPTLPRLPATGTGADEDRVLLLTPLAP